MFSRGFVRVVETDSEIMVDSPRPLNRMHRRFLEDKVIREGKKLIVNGREVLESRDKVSKAGQLVAKLIQ